MITQTQKTSKHLASAHLYLYIMVTKDKDLSNNHNPILCKKAAIMPKNMLLSNCSFCGCRCRYRCSGRCSGSGSGSGSGSVHSHHKLSSYYGTLHYITSVGMSLVFAHFCVPTVGVDREERVMVMVMEKLLLMQGKKLSPT